MEVQATFVVDMSFTPWEGMKNIIKMFLVSVAELGIGSYGTNPLLVFQKLPKVEIEKTTCDQSP